MKTALVLAGLAFIVFMIALVAFLLWNSDGKGCDKGGPDCVWCPFPCEYNRTYEKKKKCKRK